MANGSDKICSCCKKQLNPPYDMIYKHGRSILCESCEKEKTSAKKSSQNKTANDTSEDKTLLYKTIIELFNVKEIPEWWIIQIDKLHKEGKSYLAMEYTLRYAILYNGFVPQEEYGISGIISMFYKEAASNYNKEEGVKALNQSINLKKESNTICIKRPKATLWKPTSRIEDL